MISLTTLARVVLTGLLIAPALASAQAPKAAAPVMDCQALARSVPVVKAEMHAAEGTLPAHCELFGTLHERTGVDGQRYAIRFHLRLPTTWNGRFYFEGGGGSNGVVGDAFGRAPPGLPRALEQGYAVVSQDSGHDNATNSNPARGGAVAFGFDPQARADYGHASLKVVADAAKALVAAYYGHNPAYSYFVGCSKGGEEGMAFAQRYPDEFNGIVAAAPGISLPRAALAEAWDVQSLAGLTDAEQPRHINVTKLAAAFSDADLKLIGDAVLAACDADDGVKDGLVSDFAACTDAKVLPALAQRTCRAEKTAACLSTAQVDAFKHIHAGPRDATGKALYSAWPWDAGVVAPGWRLWMLGSADGRVPALHIVLGGASLAAVFSTPPREISSDLQSIADFQTAFDLTRDAHLIDATDATFKSSAWQDISARSPDLTHFASGGGKMIVWHGVSDPVFSIEDTVAWYQEFLRGASDGAKTVRLFPVPGLTHCGGGPATGQFDALQALVDWVEHGRAPDRLLASAGPDTPWPNRTRPLCAYPSVARYRGQGDIERADNFVCSER